MRKVTIYLLISLVLLTVQSAAGLTSIRGFAGWAAAVSDPYPDQIGVGEGKLDSSHVEFSLNLAASPIDKLILMIQIHFESNSHDVEEAKIEFASAAYRLSDRVEGKVGRSMLPFGYYNLFYHVGTQRPFFSLPQSFYGPTGFRAESYSGIGFLGTVGDSWELSYDVYGGAVTVEVERAFTDALAGETTELGEDEHLEKVLGSRLVLSTPVDGLSFGFSIFSGQPEDDQDSPSPPRWGDHLSYAVMMEHDRGPFTLRAEWGYHRGRHGINLGIESYYVEVSHKITKRWQLAGRYEAAEVDLPKVDVPTAVQSLLEHQEIAFGVNYWLVDSHLVLRLSAHWNTGNLLNHPEGDDLLRAIATNSLDRRTTQFLLGAHYAF